MNQLRDEYMRQQASLWDDTYDGLRATFRSHLDEVKFVIENWDVLDHMAWFGRTHRDKEGVAGLVAQHSYDLPTRLIDAMWWVTHFVSHEIHDDGSPAIVWMKRDVGLLDPPKDPEDKIERLRRKTILAPWNWSAEDEEGSIPVLVHDDGGLLWPHAKFIGSTDSQSVLFRVVKSERARIEKADAAWNSIRKGEPRVRAESEVQRDLKSILDDLFKQEFMP